MTAASSASVLDCPVVPETLIVDPEAPYYVSHSLDALRTWSCNLSVQASSDAFTLRFDVLGVVVMNWVPDVVSVIDGTSVSRVQPYEESYPSIYTCSHATLLAVSRLPWMATVGFVLRVAAVAQATCSARRCAARGSRAKGGRMGVDWGRGQDGGC